MYDKLSLMIYSSCHVDIAMNIIIQKAIYKIIYFVFLIVYNSTFPHEKHIKDIEISAYFKNTISYLT